MTHSRHREKGTLVHRDICRHERNYFGVWSSAAHLKVATQLGEVRLDFHPKDMLILDSCFVGNRFLVVTLGQSVSVFGIRVYDLEKSDWIETKRISATDVAILGRHPSLSLVAISNEGSVEIWDLVLGTTKNLGLLEHEIECVTFLVDSRILGVGDKSVGFLSENKYERVFSFSKNILSSEILGLDYRENEGRIFISYLHEILEFDVKVVRSIIPMPVPTNRTRSRSSRTKIQPSTLMERRSKLNPEIVRLSWMAIM